jgi:hypothetical protein
MLGRKQRREGYAVVIICAAVAAGAGGLGGCGSSSSGSSGGSSASSKPTSYTKRAEAICQAMRDRLRQPFPYRNFNPSRPNNTLLPKAGRFLRGREQTVSRAIAQLSALPAPPRGQRPAVKRLLSELRTTDQLDGAQFRAALTGNRPGFVRASAAIRTNLNAEGGAARRAHVAACAVPKPPATPH